MIWLIVKGRGRDEHHWVAALGRVYTPKEPVVGLGGRTLVHSIALPKSCKDTGQESSEWKATEGHALLYASKESNRMVWVRRKKCVRWELVGAVKVHVSSEAPLAEQVSATTITSCSECVTQGEDKPICRMVVASSKKKRHTQAMCRKKKRRRHVGRDKVQRLQVVHTPSLLFLDARGNQEQRRKTYGWCLLVDCYC